jgi:hypothetical protein
MASCRRLADLKSTYWTEGRAHLGSQHSHLSLAWVIDTLKWCATFDHLTGGSVTTPDCTFQPVIGCESVVTPEIFSLIP